MRTPDDVASVLWCAWLLSWFLAARWSARTVARQPVIQRLVQMGLVCSGSVLLFWPKATGGCLQAPLFALAPWVKWGATVLILAGFAFTWWARIHLGRLWSGNVTLKADHSLVSSGPYGLTRNPIYTGLVLALVATAAIRNQPAAWIGLALILIGLMVKIRQEEQLLTARFGEAYIAYRKAVPALIPRRWSPAKPTQL